MLQQIVMDGPVVLLPAASASVVCVSLSAIFAFIAQRPASPWWAGAAAASLSSGVPEANAILTAAVQPGLA